MKWKILFLLLLCVGLFLKLYRYTEYPQRGATSDEYTYAFLGLSLLNTGVPVSWSHFGAYPARYDLTIDGIHFPMVSPYFDHPPLAGLVVASWAKFFGENTFAAITLSTIRLVPILLTSISALLLYLLAVRFYGNAIGLLALAIYSTATIFVMHHRMVLAENFLTVFFLGAIYLFDRFKRRLTTHRVFLLACVAGASFWTKESGVAVFVALLLLLVLGKVKRRLLWVFCGTFLLFVFGYIAYGYTYDGVLFWKIMSLQSVRDIGPQTIWYLFSTPVIVNKIFHDGWYFFGLVSLLVILADRGSVLITIPFLTYFFLLLFTLTKEGQSGWYMIPTFPFMAIASAATIVKSIKEKSWFFLVFVAFVGMFLIEKLFIPNFGLVPSQFRILTGILIGPPAFLLVLGKAKMFTRLAYVWLTMLLIGTTLVTFFFKHLI